MNSVNMAIIIWDPKAREFLRKLPKSIANRIYRKVDKVIRFNITRNLESFANRDGYKMRIGDYRLFVDYYKERNLLIIRTIRHRRHAYKI